MELYRSLICRLIKIFCFGTYFIRNFMGNCTSTDESNPSITDPALPLNLGFLSDSLAAGNSNSTPSTETLTTLSKKKSSCDCVPIDPGDDTNAGYLMHEAIVQNDLIYCTKLLKSGFPINSPLQYCSNLPVEQTPKERSLNEFMGTALHVAIIYRRPEVVDLLLEHSANPNAIDKHGRSAVNLAVAYWPRMVFNLQAKTNTTTEENHYYDYLTRLHRNSYHCLESLCCHQADVNQPSGALRETPLHLAAKYHIPACAELLIRHGASVNARDAQGMTPLHYTCRPNCSYGKGENKETMELLVKNGADVNSVDNNYCTPLHLAALNGSEILIRQLIKMNADVDCRNDRGLSPLYLLLDDIRNIFCVNGLSAILSATTYIHIFDEHGQLPSLLNLPALEGVQAALVAAATQPPPLLLLSTRIIQKAIGRQRLTDETVSQLSCPRSIKLAILGQGNLFFSNLEEWYGKT